MDIAGIAKAASSIAETGNKQDVDVAVLRRAQQIEASTGTQLVDAIKSVPTSNLPAHLGNTINTTA
jgi:hypothetical protein